MDNETLKTILELQKENIMYKTYIAQMELMIELGEPIQMSISDDNSLSAVYEFLYVHFENKNKR
jgi:hypothetical protein